MEASTTIKKMLAGNKIFVPSYQRAYSWDTEIDSTESKKQTNVFLSDLEDYIKSSAITPYYFGHFLFEERPEEIFGVIDGQQRLTTIIIFLSALFTRLKSIRELNESEIKIYEDIVKRQTEYTFSTVDYDNQLFRDYVINQTKKDNKGIETVSAKRIVSAFNFFKHSVSNKDENYLIKMLTTITKASCSTHPVTNEAEAIQMFIFQNNRGKKPSDLEIIKAQFMFNVHLYGGAETKSLIEEIKNRFEKIYKSISSIEYRIDEDDVLLYTLRVHFNSLAESGAKDRIAKLISSDNPIPFIKSFTNSLATSFEHLTSFFGEDERKNIEIHSLITLGGIAFAMPFVIKAYRFGIVTDDICRLCSTLECLILRQRLIGTGAYLESRMKDVFARFTEENSSINPIVERVNFLKSTSDWWWAYWNNDRFVASIQEGLHHPTAKFLLWKYENHLEMQGKRGYEPSRFDKIINPELEHIAPQTPTNGEPIAAGYCEYDEDFKQHYINCLGNFLLLSKSHNCSVGNIAFADKRETYKHNAQQREIKEMTLDNIVWSKEKIKQRKEKLISFIMETW